MELDEALGEKMGPKIFAHSNQRFSPSQITGILFGQTCSSLDIPLTGF
jgi:hypothetical protein